MQRILHRLLHSHLHSHSHSHFAVVLRSRIEWHNINPKVVEPRLAGDQNAFLIMHMEGWQKGVRRSKNCRQVLFADELELWSCQANFLTSLKSVSVSVSGSYPRRCPPSWYCYRHWYRPYAPYPRPLRLDKICLSGSFCTCSATFVAAFCRNLSVWCDTNPGKFRLTSASPTWKVSDLICGIYA